MLKIRLARGGTKKRPYYYIVVADSHAPRDGKFLERVGTYNPMLPKDGDKPRVNLKADRIDAYVTVQWTSTRFVAQESGGSVLIDFAEKGVPDLLRNQAVVAISMREESIEKNPDMATNWLKAQEDASKWIVENKDDAASLLNRTGLGGKGLEIAKQYVEHYATDIAPNLKPMFKADKATVDHMAELALRFGSVKKGDITYESLVPEFARAYGIES